MFFIIHHYCFNACISKFIYRYPDVDLANTTAFEISAFALWNEVVFNFIAHFKIIYLIIFPCTMIPTVFTNSLNFSFNNHIGLYIVWLIPNTRIMVTIANFCCSVAIDGIVLPLSA